MAELAPARSDRTATRTELPLKSGAVNVATRYVWLPTLRSPWSGNWRVVTPGSELATTRPSRSTTAGRCSTRRTSRV